MTKILIVISEAPPIRSGVSRVAENLSKGLRARGFHVDILSLQDIPRVELGEVRLSSMLLKLKSLRQKLSKYDLINLHGPVPTFSDVFLLAGLRGLGHNRPRLIFTYHAPIEFNFFLLRPVTWLYNRLQEKLARLADHVVVTSPSYGQRLSSQIPASKLSVIPWGVDFNRFATTTQKDNPFTVVYLGQIRPYKGLPILLKSIDGVSDLRLWVIGNGHYIQKCQEQAKQLDLQQVTFWGSIPDNEVNDLLKKAHVIVLPSVNRSEAFGISLLEGMAAGLVPVASHLPGVADLVGIEGITFKPRDFRALQSILIRLRDDSALTTHLAGLAQKKSKLYPWERVIFEYERVFKLLGSPSYYPSDLLSKEVPTQPLFSGYPD